MAASRGSTSGSVSGTHRSRSTKQNGEQDEDSQRQSIATVERAADILILFSRVAEPQLGVTEIAQQLSLSKAAVHRTLASLRSRGLVELDPDTRRYRLGTESLALGLAYLSRVDVRAMAAPELAHLSRTAQETATLSVRHGDERAYLDQSRPDREIVMSIPIGAAFPLHAGSSSKALLAFLPSDEIDRYLKQKLDRITERTATDPMALRTELASIREKGYAVSFGERQPGAASIAAPVFDHTGSPVATVSICGPAERFRPETEDTIALLLDAVQRISHRMGHSFT
ncbi:MAG: IclR family transcriptional regulator [Nocardiopsaceae bacterium]|nr:IclR family transcriptional regulator [Nocardiopsaceae bacterium]